MPKVTKPLTKEDVEALVYDRVNGAHNLGVIREVLDFIDEMNYQDARNAQKEALSGVPDEDLFD